jgi:hypothetical protein
MRYELSRDKRELFSALVLLDAMFTKGFHFPIDFQGVDIPLEPIFLRMRDKDLVVDENQEYVVTEKGAELINNFYDRFQEFLKVYDIYCAVDLEKGEFAFSSFFDITDENEWRAFLDDKRWDDVRVAVCEFKKIDPLEIVFISFLKENRIDLESDGWQDVIYNGRMWDEIVQVCETAVPLSDLLVDDAIQDIIKQGSEVLHFLLEREKEIKQAQIEESTITTEEVTTVTEEITVIDNNIEYYDPYWNDIYYVSPCWGLYYYDPYWW